MYVLPATDELTPFEPLQVTVVTAVSSLHTQAIVDQLRRESMSVQIASVSILDTPPPCPVCVVSLESPQLRKLGPQFVAWAASIEVRAGLIGIVDKGSQTIEELLACGFDDALATPVLPRELVARVKAVHRRVHWKGVSNGRVRFADLTLDVYGRALWLDGKTISLTTIELAVMRELMKARGKPLSRGDLLDRAWGEGELEVSERAVDNVILRLRRKLPAPDLIETVRSVGFRIADRG